MKKWGTTEMDFFGLQSVVPDVGETFGGLLFAGVGEDISWNIDGEPLRGKFYNLISSTLRGQNVEVLLLGDGEVKTYDFGTPIILIHPRVRAQNHKTESGGCSRLLLVAEDIEPL